MINKYRITSAVCALFAIWFFYAATLGPDAGDLAGMCIDLACACFAISLAFTPQLLFERVKMEHVWRSETPQPKVAMVFSLVGAVAMLAGIIVWASEKWL